MATIEFKKAYYINLGLKKKFFKSSIEGNIIQTEWNKIPLPIINGDDIGSLRKCHAEKYDYTGGAQTRDFNALTSFKQSTENDVWITRGAVPATPGTQYLYWCMIREGEILNDRENLSVYRKTKTAWTNKNIKGDLLEITRCGQNKTYTVNGIAPDLAGTTSFSGTLCRVKAVETLRDLINGEI